jgi:hypothetical protein
MVNTIKFSQFPSSTVGDPSNRNAGLSMGLNAITPEYYTWTTSTRPSTPSNGVAGYNSDLLGWEFWNGTTWVQFTSVSPGASFAAGTAGHNNITGNNPPPYTAIYEIIQRNVGGNYSGTTGKFTATSNGLHLFSCVNSYTGIQSDNLYGNTFFLVGGVEYSFNAVNPASVYNVSNTQYDVGSSLLIPMTIGQTAEIQVDIRGNASNNVNLAIGSYFSGAFFSI